MFGKNPLSKPDLGDGATLWMQEVFGTIQGEGPLAGTPAIFCRVSGCGLKCVMCDTDFSSSTWHPTLDEIMGRIDTLRFDVAAQLIVLTGGEPLRQNVVPLLRRCLDSGYTVQIETAGYIWPSGMNDPDIELALIDKRIVIVCSPKTGTVVKNVQRWCRDYKLIVGRDGNDAHGLPAKSTQIVDKDDVLFRPPAGTAQIWLQPREEYYPDGSRNPDRTLVNMKAAAELCMRHGYRLSLQTHKILGLR